LAKPCFYYTRAHNIIILLLLCIKADRSRFYYYYVFNQIENIILYTDVGLYSTLSDLTHNNIILCLVVVCRLIRFCTRPGPSPSSPHSLSLSLFLFLSRYNIIFPFFIHHAYIDRTESPTAYEIYHTRTILCISLVTEKYLQQL